MRLFSIISIFLFYIIEINCTRFQLRLIRDGTVRLVGGKNKYEGNVEIYHLGRWGTICDDEWDLSEANVICKQLNFKFGAVKATDNSFFGPGRNLIWMDNLYCNGSESRISHCMFDGWKKHDCGKNEAAGVICREMPSRYKMPKRLKHNKTVVIKAKVPYLIDHYVAKVNDKINVRLSGGQSKFEGRVEVQLSKYDRWRLVCAKKWTIFEAMVVCRSLGLGYAEIPSVGDYYGGHNMSFALKDVKCSGNEENIDDCQIKFIDDYNSCSGGANNIANVICTREMADLIPDARALERSVYLEDRQLLLLQCAAEENCLSSSTNLVAPTRLSKLFETRRLLRFTAKITNNGTADFRPFTPKEKWQWHTCHRHYHSMEVFAHFDLLNFSGERVAEGHKASFCLEDQKCDNGIKPKYKCANYGDQGISVGCADTYLHNIDCQWLDITDIDSGYYQLKMSINPEFKVAEKSFDNNAVLCNLYYNKVEARVWNCTLIRP